MGSVFCCCQPPDIDTLRADPNVIDCINIGNICRVTLNDGPGYTSHVLAGGCVIYYTNEHLVHLLCVCGLNCNAQYPLSDIKKVEFIQGNSVIVYGDESIDLPRKPGSGTGTGVRVTTKPSATGYYNLLYSAVMMLSNLSVICHNSWRGKESCWSST